MNAAQKIFVDEMVKHGNEEKAVLKAYPNIKTDAKSIRTQCGRLLKNAEVSAAIQQRAKQIEDIAIEKASEELKGKIVANTLDVIEKRNILAQIARGEISVQEHYFDREAGGMESFFREPNAVEKLKAIDLDNKMTGDNAPTKQETTIKGTIPIDKWITKTNE